MTSYTHPTTSPSTGTWWLAAIGVMGIVALMAAMVWVVEGQMQQAKVLRAQWQNSPSTAVAQRSEGRDTVNVGTGGSSTKAVRGGVMLVSFDRP